MPTVRFSAMELEAAAGRFAEAADQADTTIGTTFRRFVDQVAEDMREEVPVDSGETRDSITVEHQGGLNATVGPTNVDAQGRRVAAFIVYGTARQAPNDFLGRTAVRARESLTDFDLSDVL